LRKNGLLASRTLLITITLAVAACERPTAPELVAKIDRAEREMQSDSAAERTLGWRLGASWDLIRLLPNGRVAPNLLTDIDGKEHWFKAFVFERVVIRLDPQDGYPCPLVLRELLAVEGGRQSFMLKGSDFSQPIGSNPNCEGNFQDERASQPAWRPILWVERLGNGPQIGAISGRARIDEAGKTDDCNFLRIDRGFPLKVDCELRDYAVLLSVKLAVSKQDSTHGRISPQQMLNVSYQRVPGLRLVIHCTAERTDIGGCATMPRR
jgi:hypothetical protein